MITKKGKRSGERRHNKSHESLKKETKFTAVVKGIFLIKKGGRDGEKPQKRKTHLGKIRHVSRG